MKNGANKSPTNKLAGKLICPFVPFDWQIKLRRCDDSNFAFQLPSISPVTPIYHLHITVSVFFFSLSQIASFNHLLAEHLKMIFQTVDPNICFRIETDAIRSARTSAN